MVVNLPSHQCGAALFVPEVPHSQYYINIVGPLKHLLSLLELYCLSSTNTTSNSVTLTLQDSSSQKKEQTISSAMI